jgi:hypothetical protein
MFEEYIRQGEPDKTEKPQNVYERNRLFVLLRRK